ncbi:MAG: ABC transporter substrate-binding protein [Stellaceae bacterium]
MRGTNFLIGVLGALVLTGTALMQGARPAIAEDGYTIGLSGAITGRGSETYAPVVDAIKLYVDRLNAKGGVNGHPLQILVEDDQAEPSKAAADIKSFVEDGKVMLALNVSLSSTYAPMINDTKAAGMGLFFAGSVCPSEVYPPAAPLEFCSTAFGAHYDSRFALDFVKGVAGAPVKLGLVAMAIPISRAEIDFAEDLSKTLGMEPVDKEVIPPPTADYTPFATKLKSADPNWIYAWGPWVTQVKTLEALRRLGWSGTYIAYAHINAEDELARVKDDKFLVFGANAFFQDNLPIHQEIRAAAEGKTQYPVTQLAEGWVAATVLDDVFKLVPWPPTREKVLAAMDAVTVDTRGLRGGPLAWTKDNHFRTKTYYRVYRWDSGKQQVVQVKDWTGLDVK